MKPVPKVWFGTTDLKHRTTLRDLLHILRTVEAGDFSFYIARFYGWKRPWLFGVPNPQNFNRFKVSWATYGQQAAN